MAPDTPRDRLIVVQGCDDSNQITLSLTDAEFAVVERLADASAAASHDSCQPVIRAAR